MVNQKDTEWRRKWEATVEPLKAGMSANIGDELEWRVTIYCDTGDCGEDASRSFRAYDKGNTWAD